MVEQMSVVDAFASVLILHAPKSQNIFSISRTLSSIP